MRIRIGWDVAWRIFDHVNEDNGTDKHIDLNCLDVNEAQNIARQCIIEVAQKVSGNPSKPKSSYGPSLLCMGSAGDDAADLYGSAYSQHSLSILCANDHIAYQKQYPGGPPQSVNLILKMVKEELKLEHYYIDQA